jgi:hypothetical protein
MFSRFRLGVLNTISSKQRAGNGRLWLWFVVIQLAGALLTFLGAGRDVATQLAGLFLLLPGSFLSEYVPTQMLWRPFMWTHLGMDDFGLLDILYLPVSVAINLLIFSIATFFFRRRQKSPAA